MQAQNITSLDNLPSTTTRLIAAHDSVHNLEVAIIRHYREVLPALRFFRELMNDHDAIDRDHIVEFEDKMLTLELSVSALDTARRKAVEA